MANVKQVKFGTGTPFDIEALHFITGSLDTPAQWKQYIDDLANRGIQILIDDPATGKQEPKTAASATTMGKIYMVQFSGQTESGTYTEFITIDKGTGDPRYVWEKIGTTAADLTEYLKKDTPYSAAALGAGGHSHTVSVPTIDKDASKKLGATASGTAVGADGTASAVTSYPGASSKLVTTSITGVSGSDTASKATAGTAFNAVKSVSISSETSSGTGRVGYIASVSAPSLGGTQTFVTGYPSFSGGSATGSFVTNALKTASLDVKDTSTTGYTAIVTAQGTLSGGNATGTFNTNAIKNVTLSASDTSSDGPAFIQDVTHTAATLTGTTTFNTDAMKASVSDGILTFASANTGTVTISGGSISKTVKYMKKTTEAAGTGNVSYSAPTLGAATIKYVKVATTNISAADKGSVSFTPASLGDASIGTVTISGGAGTTKYLAVSAPTQSVTPYTFADVTVPQAAAAITVATGALSSTGSGATVMTGLGTAQTATVLTGVKVTTNPTITITEASTNTGPVNEHITITANTATTSSVANHTHDVQVNS